MTIDQIATGKTEKYFCTFCPLVDGKAQIRTLSTKYQMDIGTKQKPNNVWMTELDCKHILVNPAPFIDTLDSRLDSFMSLDEKVPYEFQKTGIKFLLNNGMRGLIADEMGLGKTPQSVITATFAYQDGKVKNILVITKSAIKRQFSREVVRWSKAELLAQVISSTSQKPLFDEGGFPVCIISYDSIWRVDWTDEEWSKFDMFILDEVQMIKRSVKPSKRSQFILDKVQGAKHVIELSGTPFNNYLPEYYNALHILDPVNFPTYNNFIYTYVDYYQKGTTVKLLGLRKDRAPLFQKKTENLVIRRRVDDVLPDLPKYQDNFRYCDMQGKYANEYAETYQKFMDAYEQNDNKTFAGFNNILQYITIMRQIVALAKTEATVDLVGDYLLETDEQLVIYIHHKKVGMKLYEGIAKLCQDGGFALPLEYTSDLSDLERDEVIRSFEERKSRIMIASTLAGGEGINLQFCRHMVLHERQWNPGKENQAKGRFRRIGSTADKIFIDYMIAAGTIDDFFAEIVAKKDSVAKFAVDGIEADWNENSLIRELMDTLYQKGISKWRL